MENVHTAIAWYQTKIGSYDKQLWEQSVERKLQKQPRYVLHGAPRKNVHLKTEYIDVDLIRGSMFTKTKPQVPWVYVTRKAISRVLFFPFYFSWWAHQSSKKLYFVLLVLYILQVVTVLVYLTSSERMEDEMCFTEVVLPISLMFLLCLIHSQTVLAHINHKPPKMNNAISGVTRKPRPKKPSRKVRSSDNNSTCQEEDGNAEPSRSSRRHTLNQKGSEPVALSLINMEGSLMSRSVSDYDLQPAVTTAQAEPSPSSSPLHNRKERTLNESRHSSVRHQGDRPTNMTKLSRQQWGKEEVSVYNVHGKWGDGADNSAQTNQKSGCSYNLLDNLPNLLTVEKVFSNARGESQDEKSSKNISELEHYGKKSGHVRTAAVPASEVGGRQSPNFYSTYPRNKCQTANDKIGGSNLCVCSEDNQKSYGSRDHRCCLGDSVKREGENCKGTQNFDKSEETTYSRMSGTENAVMYRDSECLDSQRNLHCKILNVEKHWSRMDTAACPCCCNTLELSHRIDGKELCRNQELANKCQKLRKCSHNSCECKVKQNLCHAIHRASIECSFCAGKPSSSGFEIPDHHEVGETSGKDLLNQLPLPAGTRTDSALQVVNNEGQNFSQLCPLMKAIRSSSAEGEIEMSADDGTVETLPCETAVVASHFDRPVETSPVEGKITTVVKGASHITSNGSKPKSAPTQDSTDSAISNAAPDVVCSCSIPDAETAVSQPPEMETSCLTCSAEHKVSTKSVATNQAINSKIQQNQPESVCCSEQLLSGIPLSHFKSTSNTEVEACGNKSQLIEPYMKRSCIAYKNNSNKSVDMDAYGEEQGFLQAGEGVSGNILKNGCTCRKNSNTGLPKLESVESRLEKFSEQILQEILNEDTLREVGSSTLHAHSDLVNSSSSASHLSTSSSSCIPLLTNSATTTQEPAAHPCHHHQNAISQECCTQGEFEIHSGLDDEKNYPLEESLERINISEEERHSDDESNYNPSDSDMDSDGSVNEEIHTRFDEKWKRLRFQELADETECVEKSLPPKSSKSVGASGSAVGAPASKLGSMLARSGLSTNGGGSRSVIEALARKPSPLKDLTIGRKSNNNTPIAYSSGSDKEQSESRNQMRRRRRTSGTQYETVETNRRRNVPSTHGQRPSDAKIRQMSSSDNENGGVSTVDESNKATVSSEEWEDRIQSDETTSSAYSSNSDGEAEEQGEKEGEERAENTTNSFHVINLLHPQNGSPTSTGTITQPDKVPCLIWEGNECKKIDLTALDIGWAIIEKVDILPESSDYFLIGLLFSLIISLVPIVFRVYANKGLISVEDFLSWSALVSKLVPIINSYSWRQYLLMFNGILQRFFLSLIFFFLLSVADRTFKQRLLYAKHFSYLTTSRRARKFAMPHFRLNKVRNIKIWLSLRSYLKRRGPQRSVDVIVSASFLVTVSIACLISIQMLKDTESYLDYLCNWELLVWCIALSVFLMRFMTLGLKINKKYRNLSVLITEQINLYLQMEKKPHKKEELILANNVLRLAEDLLKELESPFKISGFSANPLIYNITRIVVLSAFSAVLTEILGFKLKLHKINLKS